MKISLKRSILALTLVSVFSMTNSISLQAGYADLYPVARNVGHSLSNTKFGKCVNWISGLFSSNVPIPHGNEVIFVTKDGSFNCPEVIARRSEIVNTKLERWSQDASFSFDAPDLDKESLKRVLALEIEFYQLEQQGNKEYKIIEVLSNKFLGDEQELDRLISVADYLHFPKSCMILAAKVFKNFDFKKLLASDGQMIFNGHEALPGFFRDVMLEHVAHCVGTAGPRFRDVFREECRAKFDSLELILLSNSYIIVVCPIAFIWLKITEKYFKNSNSDSKHLLVMLTTVSSFVLSAVIFFGSKCLCKSAYRYFNVYYKDALKKKLCKKFKRFVEVSRKAWPTTII